jgi:alkylation response protein AidB-like acyl-CoA dehydrogenase
MANFFNDNEDLRFHFDRAIDWATLAQATERGARAPDGPSDLAEAVASYRDVAALMGTLAAEEIAPRAGRIDREPVRLENGQVVPGAAFQEVFDQIRRLELHRLPLPRELGGMNAPVLLWFLGCELMARADVSVMTHFSLHGGIAMALLYYSLAEGSTRLDGAGGRIAGTRFAKEIEEIASGAAWGSMDITEPDAGSDMAALRTVATEAPDGSWTVTGQKIFITSGHGKYHVVVARTGPAPGLDGLSMFLVPADDRRRVSVERVEDKLGHHGSVTAAVCFDRAPAQLLGKRGDGFRQMLLLMNNARLAVSFEALGLCEAAHRLARGHAALRHTMGRPIARHEMIADYLDEMATDIQGLRALAIHAALHEELGAKLTFVGAAAAAEHRARARRATPLLKYLAAEKAVEMARRCIQIHGGIAYTKELGAEKLLRDAIVLPIYEGTSQIQALMATKDVLGGIVKRPHELLARLAQARWRSLSAKDELERRAARIQLASLGAQQHLATRTAASKLRTHEWRRGLHFRWDPRRDFALALLHAERLTRLLADEQIVEILLAQARRFPERRELLGRYLDRAEPRCRALGDEIATTGSRILDGLSTDLAKKSA